MGLFEVCVDSTNKDADTNYTISVMDITLSVWFGDQLGTDGWWGVIE